MSGLKLCRNECQRADPIKRGTYHQFDAKAIALMASEIAMDSSRNYPKYIYYSSVDFHSHAKTSDLRPLLQVSPQVWLHDTQSRQLAVVQTQQHLKICESVKVMYGEMIVRPPHERYRAIQAPA
jgi:hypothetical protein